MTYNGRGPRAVDYQPCRYGTSRLQFRGPKQTLQGPYCAFIGGTETYGKFIRRPFPELIETSLGIECVNFGQKNAGLDAFSHDPFILPAAAGADATVFQIMGAQNMTNRYYAVHPRRNDRFISASPLMQMIYPEVDFSDFHFTRHMLTQLLRVCPQRFAIITSELQSAWLVRMRLMLKQIAGRRILLWMADRAPTDCAMPEAEPDPTVQLGSDPLFVTQEMVDQITAHASSYVEVVGLPRAMEPVAVDPFFQEMDALVAASLLGTSAHEAAADALIPVLMAREGAQKRPA